MSGRIQLTCPRPASPRGDPLATTGWPLASPGLFSLVLLLFIPLHALCLPKTVGEEVHQAPKVALLQGKARGSVGGAEAAVGEGKKGQNTQDVPHPFLLRWHISPFLALFQVALCLEGEGEGERGAVSAVAFP